jgi:beta-mannanase
MRHGPGAQSVEGTLEPPASGAYFGASAPGLADCGDALSRLNAQLGHDVAIVHWYQPWRAPEAEFPAAQAVDVAEQSAVPMISWEPWGGSSPSTVGLRDIARGRLDPYIRAWAREAASFGGPLLLRPMHAMNGSWFPWSVTARGNSPTLYVEAWRHMHRIFAAEGAANVAWVWSVSAFAGLPDEARALGSFYPGRAYVDWVGVSAFNWGTTRPFGSWRSPEQLIGPTYAALARFDKPVMVAEIGTVAAGGDPVGWIDRAMRVARAEYPDVGAVVWFGHRQGVRADFRLRGATLAAMRVALDRPAWNQTR